MGIQIFSIYSFLILSGSEDDIKARNELHSKLVKFVKQQNSELTLGRLDVFEHNALAQDLGVSRTSIKSKYKG
jgi:hypothetical protein